MAAVLKELLRRNSLTHAQLKQLHDWALPDQRTWLSTSQISGLRTQKLQALGPRCFDSLGRLNMVLGVLADVQWPRRGEVGKLPAALPPDLAHLRDAAWFAPHPLTGLPMGAGDLFEVWLGQLVPEVQSDSYSDREARRICERIALETQAWMIEAGTLPTKARASLEKAAEIQGKATKDAIWMMLMGGDALSGDQLAELVEPLMRVLGVIRGLNRGLSRQEWNRWIAGGTLA